MTEVYFPTRATTTLNRGAGMHRTEPLDHKCIMTSKTTTRVNDRLFYLYNNMENPIIV